MSAVIWAAIIAGWALVLVPKALRRHDAVDANRAGERLGAAMRVLSRRGADGRDRRWVVLPRTVDLRRRAERGSSALRRRRWAVGAAALFAVVTFFGLVLSPGLPTLAVQALADLLLIGVLVHLRRRVVAERRSRRIRSRRLRSARVRAAVVASGLVVPSRTAEATARPGVRPARPAEGDGIVTPLRPAASGRAVTVDQMGLEHADEAEVERLLERRWAVGG